MENLLCAHSLRCCLFILSYQPILGMVRAAEARPASTRASADFMTEPTARTAVTRAAASFEDVADLGGRGACSFCVCVIRGLGGCCKARAGRMEWLLLWWGARCLAGERRGSASAPISSWPSRSRAFDTQPSLALQHGSASLHPGGAGRGRLALLRQQSGARPGAQRQARCGA